MARSVRLMAAGPVAAATLVLGGLSAGPAQGMRAQPSYSRTMYSQTGHSPSAARAAAQPIALVSETFHYAGPVAQTVTVPPRAVSARVTIFGGHGGASCRGTACHTGGDGAEVTGTLPVAAGQLLTVSVAGRGGDSSYATPGGGGWGWASGGAGGSAGEYGNGGAGGGGASGVAVSRCAACTASAVVVAGGGGGGGGDGRARVLPARRQGRRGRKQRPHCRFRSRRLGARQRPRRRGGGEL
jgi:hypothetical protein